MNRLFVLGLCLVLTGCKFVEPGYVGIKVNSYGSQRGVEDFPILTGRVHFNPFTESVYEFPTFMQNRRWEIKEGEGFTFSSKEGARIEASVGLNYQLEPSKVPYLFVTHRTDLDSITDNYVRTQVQDALTKFGGQCSNIECMGTKQQEILKNVEDYLNTTLASRGFKFDNVSFIGALKPDDRVASSINAVIEATQKAQEAQAKVAEAKAVADQSRMTADGEAYSIKTRAEAQAEANKILAASITPELVRYEMLRRWDGVAPRVVGGGDAGLLIGVGDTQ